MTGNILYAIHEVRPNLQALTAKQLTESEFEEIVLVQVSETDGKNYVAVLLNEVLHEIYSEHEKVMKMFRVEKENLKHIKGTIFFDAKKKTNVLERNAGTMFIQTTT